jgi:hypothetical protein
METMKNLIKIGVVSSMLLFLTSCAGDYSEYTRSINQTNQTNAMVASSYFENQSKMNEAMMNKLADNETAAILYAILTNQSNKDTAESFKAISPIKPRTQNDVFSDVANNTVPTLVRWGAGAFIGKQFFDTMATANSIVVSGAGASYTQDSFNSGSYNNLVESELTSSGAYEGIDYTANNDNSTTEE